MINENGYILIEKSVWYFSERKQCKIQKVKIGDGDVMMCLHKKR